MMTGGYCEEPLGRRGNLGPRLLRFARNDSIRLAAGVTMLLLAITSPAQAVRPDEMLSDPGLEARAREVGRELRCLVCRNQSIDDSDADLAHDLRVLVRERITAGDSDDRVIAYVRARYGDFVLLRPPLELGTLLLWGGPLLILVIGGLAIARFYRTRREDPVAPLSPDERRRLASVLGAPPPFPPPLAGGGRGGGEGGDG
jgi:cytochrome c-type biogenesis protein CcmH